MNKQKSMNDFFIDEFEEEQRGKEEVKSKPFFLVHKGSEGCEVIDVNEYGEEIHIKIGESYICNKLKTRKYSIVVYKESFFKTCRFYKDIPESVLNLTPVDLSKYPYETREIEPVESGLVSIQKFWR